MYWDVAALKSVFDWQGEGNHIFILSELPVIASLRHCVIASPLVLFESMPSDTWRSDFLFSHLTHDLEFLQAFMTLVIDTEECFLIGPYYSGIAFLI